MTSRPPIPSSTKPGRSSTSCARRAITTEDVVAGLALAKFTRFSSWGVAGAPGSEATDLQQTADLLRPWIKKPGHVGADPDALRRRAQLPESHAAGGTGRGGVRGGPGNPARRRRPQPGRPACGIDLCRHHGFAGAASAADGQGRRGRTARDRGLLVCRESAGQASRRPAVDGESRAGRRPARTPGHPPPRLRGRHRLRREGGRSRRKLRPLQPLGPEFLGLLGPRPRPAGQRAAGTGPDRRRDRRLPETGGAGAGFAQTREPGTAAVEQLGPVDDQRGTRRSIRCGPEIAVGGRGGRQGDGGPGKAGKCATGPVRHVWRCPAGSTRPGPGQQPGRIRPGNAVGGPHARPRVFAGRVRRQHP